MVLFTLINISLDISANVSWWIIKNTLYGTYYAITYINYKQPKPTKEELELIELKYLVNDLNKKLHLINKTNNEDLINLDNEFVFIQNEHKSIKID
jgi:hypothetical protein